MAKKIEITEDELRKLYLEELRGQEEIAKMYGCTAPTISTRLRAYGIKTRPLNSQRVIDRQKGLIKKPKKEIIPGQPIDCNTQGKKCIYGTAKTQRNIHLCDYFFKTGKLRWCDPEQCTKYRLKK